MCSCEALGVGPWWQGGDACSSFHQCLNCLAASALALASMGWFLGKQPQKEYFYYHMGGLWWWEVDYEWWYFDEAKPTAQKLVVVLCLECIAGLLSLGQCVHLGRLGWLLPSHLRRVGRSRLGAWGQWQACDV